MSDLKITAIIKLDLQDLYIISMLGEGYLTTEIAKKLGLGLAGFTARYKKHRKVFGEIYENSGRYKRLAVNESGKIISQKCMETLKHLGVEIEMPEMNAPSRMVRL